MSIDAPEILRVKTKTVSCDGGEGALGHPRVYLTMDSEGKVECGYCDRLFLLEGSEADKAHGK
jgi:uncharacterized Zn-finger protein